MMTMMMMTVPIRVVLEVCQVCHNCFIQEEEIVTTPIHINNNNSGNNDHPRP